MGEAPNLFVGEVEEIVAVYVDDRTVDPDALGFHQGWFKRIGNRVFALKGPRYPALFSERNRRNVRVLPLFGGWRITIRKVSA